MRTQRTITCIVLYSRIETEFSKSWSQYKSSKKPWWNGELSALRKDLRKCQNECIRLSTTLEKNRLMADI